MNENFLQQFPRTEHYQWLCFHQQMFQKKTVILLKQAFSLVKLLFFSHPRNQMLTHQFYIFSSLDIINLIISILFEKDLIWNLIWKRLFLWVMLKISNRRCSIKKTVLKNPEDLRFATLLKRDPNTGVFLWILQNFKNIYF